MMGSKWQLLFLQQYLPFLTARVKWHALDSGSSTLKTKGHILTGKRFRLFHKPHENTSVLSGNVQFLPVCPTSHKSGENEARFS